MRDPLLHLDLQSDFHELMLIADQTQSVGIDDLGEDLRRVARVQRRAQRGPLSPSILHSNLGDFNDIS